MARPYSTANRRPRLTTKASGSRHPDYESARWRAERREFLNRNPICACGCGAKATVVDHIVPWRHHPGGFFDQSNWQALHWNCHQRKTRSDQTGRPVRPPRPVIDPLTGLPLPGSGHWWSDP